MNSNEFWAGVLTGSLASFILAVVAILMILNQGQELRKEVGELRKEVESVKKWEEENETVMKTYEFFNKSWEAIIKLQEDRKDD